MQLRFLGTGTSMGVPVIGCDCPICTSDDPRNRRMRTSALLREAGQTILIDAGPDFRAQALSAGLRHIDAVILTHSHFDHVAGIDDLRPICGDGGCVPIFGSPRTLADVRERFAYAFTESSAGSTRPSIELRAVEGPFMIGPTQIAPLDILHGTWPITGYRIGGLGYVTDASAISAESRGQLRGLDVLVLNALRYEPHPTHLSLSEALAVIADLRPRRAFLVHMTHAFDHASAGAALPPGVAFAYDGLEINVEC
ncbi:MBL fold metallo-hydrolase [Oscillochloris sp. ZM17-4]|uniref:MBL fold metallo-hydrolase n=1 Tax=Oscillochloris sp. ZM17-4 TaxID=2866714 RepID=UPI001C731E10|nr:MBL fold metallo-hydrolase [Oscillochloris sp. ZM17-4]MBX0327693.1 MBL fold metallo-hydrolase [Oscillochloris sp. ZM17-4]